MTNREYPDDPKDPQDELPTAQDVSGQVLPEKVRDDAPPENPSGG